MFGYITVNKAELKFREFDVYQAYYCGLCRNLKQRYGLFGQATLTYDMTFLLLLLTGLYEPEEAQICCRCGVHPVRKHPVLSNPITSYAADMNLMLGYYKCEDDWNDERSLKKKLFSRLLVNGFQKVKQNYPEKLSVIETSLASITRYEAAGETNIDLPAGCFGVLMAEIFVWRSDEWESTLRGIGYYLGKFIYLADAYEDLEEDRAKGLFNPLESLSASPGFEDSCETMMTMMMAECSRLFEQLPILNYVSILRNILYSGVWQKYEAVKKKKAEQYKDDKIAKAGESK